MQGKKQEDPTKQKRFLVPDIPDDYDAIDEVYAKKTTIRASVVDAITEEITRYNMHGVDTKMKAKIDLGEIPMEQGVSAQKTILHIQESFLYQLQHRQLIKGLNFSAHDHLSEIGWETSQTATFIVNPQKLEEIQQCIDLDGEDNAIPVSNKSVSEKGKIPKVTMKDDRVCWGDRCVPMERGQNVMFRLLFENREEIRDKRLMRKGSEQNVKVLAGSAKYRNDTSFRDALKKLRSKLKGKDLPININSKGTGYYLMVISYT